MSLTFVPPLVIKSCGWDYQCKTERRRTNSEGLDFSKPLSALLVGAGQSSIVRVPVITNVSVLRAYLPAAAGWEESPQCLPHWSSRHVVLLQAAVMLASFKETVVSSAECQKSPFQQGPVENYNISRICDTQGVRNSYARENLRRVKFAVSNNGGVV